jgi:GR25 family glycosyltransferase involved in LPS biosynthesis
LAAFLFTGVPVCNFQHLQLGLHRFSMKQVKAEMHCFVINLDRVPERWAFTRRGFDAVGISAERFSAVDARRLERYEGIRYRPHSGDRWEIPDSLVGCFESHRRLWQRVVDDNLPMAAIFEDDIVVTEEMPAVIHWLKNGGADFDVVKLDSAGRAVRHGPVVTSREDHSLRPILAGTTSAGAYVVSQRGAERLLEWSDPYSDHVDDFVFAPRAGSIVLQLAPIAAAQLVHLPLEAVSRLEGADAPTLSESERERDPALNRKVRRGPPWFRLRKEIRRTARKLYWRLYGDRALLARGGIITDFAMTPDRIARLK